MATPEEILALPSSSGQWRSLHEAITCVDAPAVAVSARDGQLTGCGVDGVYYQDRRVLSKLVLCVDGREAEPIHAQLVGVSGARFVGVLYDADHGPDPVLVVERRRGAGGRHERALVRNHGRFQAELV